MRGQEPIGIYKKKRWVIHSHYLEKITALVSDLPLTSSKEAIENSPDLKDLKKIKENVAFIRQTGIISVCTVLDCFF
jgi:hypothetical protein